MVDNIGVIVAMVTMVVLALTIVLLKVRTDTNLLKLDTWSRTTLYEHISLFETKTKLKILRSWS
jgi:hypothetical protein